MKNSGISHGSLYVRLEKILYDSIKLFKIAMIFEIYNILNLQKKLFYISRSICYKIYR